MKKILLMFVILITSIANAQTTDFDFSCSSSEVRANRSALITDLEGTNGVTNITVAYQSNDNYVYISTSKGRFYFASDDGNYTQNTSLVGSGHLEAYSQGSFDTRLLAFKIFLDPSLELNLSIEAMYAADTHPETLSSIIFNAAGDAYDNRSAAANDPRLVFIAKLNKFGVVFEGFENKNDGNRYVTFVDDTIDPIQAPVDGVNLTTADFQEWMLRIARGIWLYEHQDYIYEQRKLDRIAEILAIDVNDDLSIRNDASTFFISNGDKANVSEVVISDAILYAYDNAEFLTKKGEVQAAYGNQATKLGTRTARIGTLKNNGNGYVTVTHRYDDGRGDLFNISYGGSTQHEYANTHSGGAYIRLESLDSGQYNTLNNAIIARVSNLTPTVAKELAAWFGDTDTAPVGSAPRWLPDALHDKANTLTNGTERLDYITGGLLSTHGVTITRGGLGQTGATNTTFILSKGDGYDFIFDWGAYSSNGFNGNNNASPELYRNLVFDVIVAGWKLINETNNTKRSDWLDQDLDIPGNDVELQTYGSPNFDWWIYFNVDGLQIPILSGGVSYDPMYYNKYTVNPHDTYMTEVEFQRLVVFVTYMRDNFDRLKGITGTFGRNIEISNLTDEFGAGISVVNDGGSYHYTFSKNGNSNEYPVQSNWTHPAGTTLEDLSPDNWVKFYAKCRGILIGL